MERRALWGRGAPLPETHILCYNFFMEQGHRHAAAFWVLGAITTISLFAPTIVGAAILFGPDAHAKNYTLTATPLSTTVLTGWSDLGTDVLGAFATIRPTNTNATPTEVLLLPCINGRPCVNISIEEPSLFTGVFSLFHEPYALAVDGASADEILHASNTLCRNARDRSSQSTSLSATFDIVTTDTIISTSYTALSCDSLFPDKSRSSFLYRLNFSSVFPSN